MYKPMVAIDVAAKNATVDPREGSARRNDKIAPSHMVRIGALKRASTLLKKNGRPGMPD